MSEATKTWAPIKKALDAGGYKRCYDRLERNPGIPYLVLYVAKQKRDVWVEMKYADYPEETGVIDLGLRKEQFIWMRNAYEIGRSVILLARVGKWWYIWNNVQAWELAKYTCSWAQLKSLHDVQNDDPQEIVKVLQTYDFTKSK